MGDFILVFYHCNYTVWCGVHMEDSGQSWLSPSVRGVLEFELRLSVVHGKDLHTDLPPRASSTVSKHIVQYSNFTSCLP